MKTSKEFPYSEIENLLEDFNKRPISSEQNRDVCPSDDIGILPKNTHTTWRA